MDADSGQYLSFDIGDERYAVPVVNVEVVLETPVLPASQRVFLI
jgi:chemotaxis signal transduction protein